MKEEASSDKQQRNHLDSSETREKKPWETPSLSELKTEQTHGGATTPGPDTATRS